MFLGSPNNRACVLIKQNGECARIAHSTFYKSTFSERERDRTNKICYYKPLLHRFNIYVDVEIIYP